MVPVYSNAGRLIMRLDNRLASWEQLAVLAVHEEL